MEVVSAEVAGALAGGESGSDLGERQILGGAAGALLPVEEELAVAVGKASSVVDPKRGQGPVDPVGRALELCVVADGGLVNDEVHGGLAAVGPLGAVLFVGEGWSVADLLEDFGESGTFSYSRLCLDANFVAGIFGSVLLIADPLVGDGAEGAVLADAEKGAFGAEISGRCVVEGVVLEGAWCLQMEAQLREP